MCAILEHSQSPETVLARVEVVILETVHLAISLVAAVTDGTDERLVPALGLLKRKTEVDCIVDGKVTLTTCQLDSL